MTDVLTALDAVLATADAQALSLEAAADRARLRELVAAALGEPASPLTVGDAIDLRHVVEYLSPDGRWFQHRLDGWSRWWRASPLGRERWTTWGHPYDLIDEEREQPCRLVPVAEADRDPAERGPL